MKATGQRQADQTPGEAPPGGIQLGLEQQFAALEAELDSLYEVVPFGCHSLGPDGTYLRINSKELEWLGYTREEVIGKMKPADFLTPDGNEKFRQLFPRLIKNGHIENIELELKGKDGTTRQTLLFATAINDTDGHFLMSRSVLFDITAHSRAENEQRIAAIVFNTHEGIIITDDHGVIIRVNPAFTKLTGYSEAEAVGHKPSLLQSGRHGPEFYQRMWAALKKKGFWQGEVWNRRKNGKIYAEWLTISAVVSPEGVTTNYVGTFSDITKNKKAAAEIHRLAYYDALTHLPNRVLLSDRLAQALAGGQRSGHYGALLILDLDNFKKLNDTRGHAVGDLMLAEIALRLLNVIREDDTVARMGGDEFVIMLEGLSTDAAAAAHQASLVGDKVLKAIAQPFTHENQEFYFTASIGSCLFHGHDEPAESLLKQADLALHKVKSSGRNALCFFNPAMQTTQDERSSLENNLHHALKHSQLHLHYQPQMDADRHIIGAEALLRWAHPERGIVPPDDFIPLAEDTGMILPIGRWVIASACAQLKTWSTSPLTQELVLAVNVSSRQFNQPDFVAEVRQILNESGADPTRLKIELTESIVIDNFAGITAQMLELKNLGISFSMDDFGTGFSSLSYLKRLPLDQLKIDRSFIRELASDPNDAAIVNTIITMGKTLGLHVIAEGVETEEQLQRLTEYGCTSFQGYLFSKPLPLNLFEEFVLKSEP